MQIFMSYSRKNGEAADLLHQDIEDLGHTLWLDQELIGGQAWWDEILSQIRKCEVFVFVLSEEALNSAPCMREISYAAQLRKRILPVLVTDGVPGNLLPQELSKIQFVDYRFHDKAAVFALNKSFQNLPPQQPLPDPLPRAPEVPVTYLSRIREMLESGLPQDFNSQIALVYDLKGHLSNKDEYDDVRRLLEDIRRNPGLLAKVASEIDAILVDAAKLPTNRPRPFGKKKPVYPTPLTSKPGSFDGEVGSTVPPKKAGLSRLIKVVFSATVGSLVLLLFLLLVLLTFPWNIIIGIGGVFLLAAFFVVRALVD